MKFVKRILVMVMAIFMTFTFTACSIFDIFALLLSGFMGEEYGDLSFEYVLTEDDLTEFEELVKEFEELGMEGTNVLSLNFVSLEMMDKFDYL